LRAPRFFCGESFPNIRHVSLGLEPVGSTPVQLAAHLKSEIARWAKLARKVKFEVAD